MKAAGVVRHKRALAEPEKKELKCYCPRDSVDLSILSLLHWVCKIFGVLLVFLRFFSANRTADLYKH